ncbi:MAG: cobyrinate a,c-diamide synthase [Leptolyngbyaceae cyanobacterium SL_7_1]|nr:cobyrinate a,c-diamide synthase [Leptolyngbyaceae cyanobacterium SL_7_1]
MGLVIAGERSGVGKTTVTLMLLAGLHQRQKTVQSFKVGPDYIDPMFHASVTGRSCYNLDPILTSPSFVCQCFSERTRSIDAVVVEGVMGLFDGVGSEDGGSTAYIARLLHLPIVLVIDCSHLSRSVAALVHGYRSFDPHLQMAGVILNRVGSDRHLEVLKEALEPSNLPILGIVRRHQDITIPDRHLGLVPTEELPQFQSLLNRLTELSETCFDWAKLLPLLSTPRSTQLVQSRFMPLVSPLAGSPVRIALARDRAFNFYYADNMDALEQLGAELVPWSPLTDDDLPKGVHGLYLGGGFPELMAAALMENSSARRSVRRAIEAGMPTYAECGGLMYLCEQIIDFEGRSWEMVGALPTKTRMGAHLTLGYRQAIAQHNTPLLAAHTVVWGHEFHRSELTIPPAFPLYQMQRYNAAGSLPNEGWQRFQLHASYLHLHWGGRLDIPTRFVYHCAQFARQGAIV